jgi:cephalosporin-C deacetylase-like acetyl esterase
MPVKTLAAFLFVTASSFGATLTIPVAGGPLSIDGAADELMWHNAKTLTLRPAGFGDPFPRGGETRIAVRGAYLCLSARLPEPGRVVARSAGRDAAWWNEDLVSWTFRIRPAGSRSRIVKLSVNPLGGFRVDYGGAEKPAASAKDILAAARIGPAGWTAEAAIGLGQLDRIGFLAIERVRVARPAAPELHWHWPAPNEPADYELPAAGPAAIDPPGFHPAESGASNRDPLRAGLQLPHRVWSDSERRTLGVEQMVENSLRRRMAEVAARERSEWEKVRTLADWERFRDRRLDALRASLGDFPERSPLRAVVTRRAGIGEGFVIENLVFESRPNLLVTANLYLPEKPARAPAIIMVHSHHAPKIQGELQDMGMTWSRAGAAVLVMDQIGAGERLQSQPWPRESYYSRYALNIQLDLAGESLMKWMVWDVMRAVDLLLERPYIDASRIVLIGAVAGGGDPAAVAAALDDRIAAVVPFNFGEAGPEEHYLEGPRGYDFQTAWPGWGSWEMTRNLRHSAAREFFPWFLCASVAPRGFLYSFEIAWPHGVEQQPAWARYQRVFGLYGKPDRLEQVDGFGPFPGPGECTNVGAYLRKKIYPILNRWLNIPIPPAEYSNPRPERDLMCLTPPVAAERRPRTASEIALATARDRLVAARSKLSLLAAGERLDRLRASLKNRLGDIEPGGQPSARLAWSRSLPDFTVDAFTLASEPGIHLPLLLLRPAAAGASGRLPVVLALAQGGKERFLAARSAELSELLKAGSAVCLLDVRGTGETSAEAARGPGAMSLAATEQMLENTMLGAQLKDARAALRFLQTLGHIDPNRMAVWGDSFAQTNPRESLIDQSLLQRPGPRAIHQAEPLGPVLALLAALYDDRVRAVATRRGLVSYVSVLEDRFCYVPLDAVVPGILEVADIPDIVASLAPRGVLLEGLADGRNRALEEPEWRSRLQPALSAYGGIPSRLLVRTEPSGAQLARWLVEQFR